jgi:hypothetical protein
MSLARIRTPRCRGRAADAAAARWPAWGGVAAQHIDVRVHQRGQAGGVLVADRVALGAQQVHREVDVAGVPQHDRVEYEADRAELVFLPGPVRLVDLAPGAGAGSCGQGVAGLAAVRPLPRWIAVLIAFGAVAQPLGFLPLALRPHLVRTPAFQVLAAAVFTVTTVGWVALAVTVIA